MLRFLRGWSQQVTGDVSVHIIWWEAGGSPLTLPIDYLAGDVCATLGAGQATDTVEPPTHWVGEGYIAVWTLHHNAHCEAGSSDKN